MGWPREGAILVRLLPPRSAPVAPAGESSRIDDTDVILKAKTAMSSLHEIQTAIGGLSADERQALLDWLLDAERDAWDRQIAEDFAPSGRGAHWLADIDEQIRVGKFSPLE